MKNIFIISSFLMGILTAYSVMADSANAVKLDQRGDRIENRLDNKGDRIDQRLDNKGDCIDNRLDRKGERINNRLDKRAVRR